MSHLFTRTSVVATNTPSTLDPLPSLSKCKGFTRISEDSSEIAFLLVENYTMTAYSASSDRNGIFGQDNNVCCRLIFSLHAAPLWMAVKKRHLNLVLFMPYKCPLGLYQIVTISIPSVCTAQVERIN